MSPPQEPRPRLAAVRDRRRAASFLACTVACVPLAACQAPGNTSELDAARAANERHKRLFGDAELPRTIGTVENVGLQIPSISPDGRLILYLRSDQDYLSSMTLLGASDPRHTPPTGELSIWLRPLEGSPAGQRLSAYRWAHSPVWSDSGRAVAFVVNEPPASFIVHLDLESGEETVLGRDGTVNCLPRFDGGDQALLFCARQTPNEPYRVCRQSVGDAEPIPLTPRGPRCLFPVLTDGRDHVLCAEIEDDHLNWIRGGLDGVAKLATQWGLSAQPAPLQTWAGITSPLSPDRQAVMFYDAARDRVCVLHVAERLVRRHRQGSIAGCWLDRQTIALATPQGVFAVNTTTGMSISLFSGQWIPCRYVPARRRLILLGSQTPRRFAIWEVIFKDRATPQRAVAHPGAGDSRS